MIRKTKSRTTQTDGQTDRRTDGRTYRALMITMMTMMMTVTTRKLYWITTSQFDVSHIICAIYHIFQIMSKNDLYVLH